MALALNEKTRAIVQVVHFLVFFVCAWQLWVFVKRVETLKRKIWSPFVLLLGFVCLQVGSGIEIANHHYEGNWELKDFKTDLVNGVFYFFNFGAQSLMVMGLRSPRTPLLRRPTSIPDALGLVFDMIMLVAIPTTPIVYAARGRSGAIAISSAIGAFAGLGTLYRIWRNLGSLWGGVGFFGLAMCGVGATAIYKSTEVEWIHVFIGGSFIGSVVPFTLAVWGCNEPASCDDAEGSSRLELLPTRAGPAGGSMGAASGDTGGASKL